MQVQVGRGSREWRNGTQKGGKGNAKGWQTAPTPARLGKPCAIQPNRTHEGGRLTHTGQARPALCSTASLANKSQASSPGRVGQGCGGLHPAQVHQGGLAAPQILQHTGAGKACKPGRGAKQPWLQAAASVRVPWHAGLRKACVARNEQARRGAAITQEGQQPITPNPSQPPLSCSPIMARRPTSTSFWARKRRGCREKAARVTGHAFLLLCWRHNYTSFCARKRGGRGKIQVKQRGEVRSCCQRAAAWGPACRPPKRPPSYLPRARGPPPGPIPCVAGRPNAHIHLFLHWTNQKHRHPLTSWKGLAGRLLATSALLRGSLVAGDRAAPTRP